MTCSEWNMRTITTYYFVAVALLNYIILKTTLAWNVASVFVVPIIVMETGDAHPVRFLKNSAAMLKKTWGESLLGYIGIRFGGLLVLLGSLVLFAATIFLSIVLKNFWILGVAAVIWFLSLVAFMYLLNVASQVYLGALYVYAAEGVAPAPFDADQMNMAWKTKPGAKPARG